MPVFYVARDIERALGAEPGTDYRIISNRTAFAEEIQKRYPRHVFLIDRGVHGEKSAGIKPLDTYELLAHPETEKIIAETRISENTPVSILVFKNTSRIEAFCRGEKWKLLNPPAALAEKIENKLTQTEWLGDLAKKYLPAHEIAQMSDIEKVKIQRPFMVQWAHGHTGGGTLFIPAGRQGEKMLDGLREKFPGREARITEYVGGPVFTVNICCTGDGGVLVGNPSYQITGMLPFTGNAFATVGNDWSLPHTILSEEKVSSMTDIARAIGEKMLADGWKGLFGIDCIYGEERDRLHLIEVNARQPASTTCESGLQKKFRKKIVDVSNSKKASGLTVFEAHLAALSGQNNTAPKDGKKHSPPMLAEINDGAQIIQRIPSAFKKSPRDIAEMLRQKKYTVIEYENTEPGNDLLRIQSDRGIMETHNKCNARGKEILAVVTESDGNNVID